MENSLTPLNSDQFKYNEHNTYNQNNEKKHDWRLI